MSKNVEYFQKRKADSEAETVRLENDIANLKAQYNDYESQINDAIDSGNLSAVEKLTAKQTEVENRIKATQKIIDRKTSAAVLTVDEVAEAANAETAEYQNKIEKAEEAVLTAKKEYFKKVLAVAALVGEAWQTRAEYISLIPGIEDPTTNNVQTTAFDWVSHHIKWERDSETDELLKSINPNALDLMSNATRDRWNSWAGRNHTPRRVDVTISKHTF